MSLERKQHADLVRHREFNALRRLMLQRNPQSRLGALEGTSAQGSRFESTQALTQIDDLEQQMSRQILGVPAQAEFAHTRIAPFSLVPSELQPNKLLPTPEQVVAQAAAKQFAEGHHAQTQSMLERAIGEGGAQHDHTPTWLVLLDFYRASNQPDRFEAYALDFSVRFGRSTPAWESIQHQAILAARERAPMPATTTQLHRADWSAPLFLTPPSLQELQAVIQTAQSTSRQLVIDWRDLVAIDAACWGELQRVLNSLATIPLHCKVHGIGALEHIFDTSTPETMLAHLALLRCQNQAQRFEDVALDYCVRFEVSPPDWVLPLCRFESSAELLPTPDVSPSDAMPELFGVLEGETEQIKSLIALTPKNAMVIRCSRLVRCDEQATAALKTWAEAINLAGTTVEFKNVHRLIAPYFAAQGLGQFAIITTRKD
jgi:anti-anti-sigma regulatory factor